MIQSRKRNDPPPRPVTFTAAEDLNPFELAELWADRMAWPVDGLFCLRPPGFPQRRVGAVAGWVPGPAHGMGRRGPGMLASW